MGLIDILSGAIKVVGKIIPGLGDKAKDVAEAIAGAPPELRAAMQAELHEHEKAMKALSVEELKTVLSETQLMVQSDDKYIARARPTGLYIAYLCSVALAAALIFGVKLDAAAILTLMGPLYGAQGYYMHLRTKEKMNGGNGN